MSAFLFYALHFVSFGAFGFICGCEYRDKSRQGTPPGPIPTAPPRPNAEYNFGIGRESFQLIQSSTASSLSTMVCEKLDWEWKLHGVVIHGPDGYSQFMTKGTPTSAPLQHSVKQWFAEHNELFAGCYHGEWNDLWTEAQEEITRMFMEARK